MSWFLGGVGKYTEEGLSTIKSLTQNSILSFSNQHLFLFAGGNKNTCFFDVQQNEKIYKQWLVVGLGISSDSPKKFLNKDEWQNVITKGEEKVKVDGHYVILTWNGAELNFVTDNIGLRDFYYCKDKSGNIIFSTRADWLARLTPSAINFKEFGSRWLLHNQISHNSVLNNINRVVCGGNLKILFEERKTIESKNNWLPITSEIPYDEKDFYSSLNQLTTFPLSNHKLSLSFSGGLDSRLLFSILGQNENKNWYAHSFGNVNHPDSLIAQSICNQRNMKHEQIDLQVPEIEKFIAELQEYSSQTLMNNSASLFCQQRNYNWFHDKDEVLIDGGFGEIWRRQFNNRLALLGKEDILHRNFKKIITFISYYRADFFTKDIKEDMLSGCEEQIAHLFSLLPDANLIGIDNWIDLLSIKTRLVNCYLHEQTRIDSIVQCYTPFIQRSILENVLLLKSVWKKNGRLFRKIIRDKAAYLAKYDLVKGKYAHPFWLSPLQSQVWNLWKEKTNRGSNSSGLKFQLVEMMNERLNDMLSSKEIRECGLYDLRKLDKMQYALAQISDNPDQIHELDWWISFELFRQQIYSK
jgi:hypothetical protein